jgi:hypothetical protein
VIQPDRNHLSNAGCERRLDQLARSPRVKALQKPGVKRKADTLIVIISFRTHLLAPLNERWRLDNHSVVAVSI